MFTIKSFVLGTLFTIWQYAKCQHQEFPINSPFSSFPSFSRFLDDSRVESFHETNQPISYDQINYENLDVGKTKQNENFGTIMNMNGNRNLEGPRSSHPAKSMNRLRQKKLRNRRMHNFRNKHLIPQLQSILQMIEPDLSTIDLDLDSPFIKNSPLQLFGRRSATSDILDNDSGNESSCQTSIDDMLIKILEMKNIVDDMHNAFMDCITTL